MAGQEKWKVSDGGGVGWEIIERRRKILSESSKSLGAGVISGSNQMDTKGGVEKGTCTFKWW